MQELTWRSASVQVQNHSSLGFAVSKLARYASYEGGGASIVGSNKGEMAAAYGALMTFLIRPCCVRARGVYAGKVSCGVAAARCLYMRL